MKGWDHTEGVGVNGKLKNNKLILNKQDIVYGLDSFVPEQRSTARPCQHCNETYLYIKRRKRRAERLLVSRGVPSVPAGSQGTPRILSGTVRVLFL